LRTTLRGTPDRALRRILPCRRLLSPRVDLFHNGFPIIVCQSLSVLTEISKVQRFLCALSGWTRTRKCVHAEIGWLSMERSLDDQNRAIAFVCSLLRDTSQHGRGQSPTSSRRNLREYQGLETIGIHFVSELSEAPCLETGRKRPAVESAGLDCLR